MSYVIRREINPNHAAIVFEFDQQSESELLRDFPWLRQIDAFAFASRPVAGSELAAESEPRKLHNRHPQSSAVVADAWLRFTSTFGRT
jgi:hypothetical protein